MFDKIKYLARKNVVISGTILTRALSDYLKRILHDSIIGKKAARYEGISFQE